ncbi:hypothetical protein HS088_TW22G00293 [Tripterygium wilfordii]|uniref:Uncharacterized protein n=1 Tax=Tripterygium wilfordii TaxID=458696 RepID=A0A7J7BXL2_TRIWF|nr:uncharacterized protein LOC119992170 [Tripterygium wilfordii]KAF5726613.1 hypothetical protein HS088_TW22G00293 [Tripterygium wilfordii]
MKIKASGFFKPIMSLLSSVAKAKSLAIKTKTSALKARLILFSLVKNRKVLLGSISNKIHSILGQQHDKDSQNGDVEGQSKAIVLYNAMSREDIETAHYDADDDDKYPDLTHSLFDDNDFVDQGGSIIDLVRNSKEEGGQNFSLEDEIDHVADLFILRFHKQMKLQKLESFKRFQEEMLARGT